MRRDGEADEYSPHASLPPKGAHFRLGAARRRQMVKLNLILTLVLVAAALSVVSARHQARKLFVTLQAEQAHARDLDVEWGQLQLEISTWLMHNRVEEVARGRLNMVIPAPGRIYVLQRDTQPRGAQP